VYGRDPYIPSNQEAWDATTGKYLKSAANGVRSYAGKLFTPSSTAADPVVNKVNGSLTAASVIAKSDPERAMQMLESVAPTINKMTKAIQAKYQEVLGKIALMR
jgi:hypothetical protein